MPLQTNSSLNLFKFTAEDRVAFALLQQWFKAAPGVVVAYSGGVDSALTLKVALQFLGSKGVLPVIGVSPSLARMELESALAFAAELGTDVELLPTNEFENPKYLRNDVNRCYYCKRTLFSTLAKYLQGNEVVSRRGWWIVDGTNADDLCEVRPGLKASQELAVRHPLAECDLNKESVRSLAKALGLKLWNKPANPCLASRLEVGTGVSISKIAMIERAEEVLRKEGLTGFRVRYHEKSGEPQAKVELQQTDLPRLVEPGFIGTMASAIRAIGFAEVFFDPQGYRSPRRHLPVLDQQRNVL